MMTNFKNKYCHYCKLKGEEIELYTSRFIVACKHGHIQNFPYIEWVDKDKAVQVRKPY